MKIGDKVLVRARSPMPSTMREELTKPQRIAYISGDFIEFESGWSANTAMGDIVELFKEGK